MHRDVLIHLAPWFAWLLVLILALRGLAALSGGRPRLARLARLHRDQRGSVQSLSFVLTLPIFIMVMMLIVQVSQLMIGQMVVEYAAIATVRSAAVWIPSQADTEGENCISSYQVDSDQSGVQGGTRYLINASTGKWMKIASSGMQALVSISPSRAVPLQNANDTRGEAVYQALYAALAPQSSANSRIATRIANKAHYAEGHTRVQLRFVHKSNEPPLATWDIGPDIGEFYFNEVGWQDTLQAKVSYDLALLPGPGRLLFSRTDGSAAGRTDQVSPEISNSAQNLYTYTISASASMISEGEKSTRPYPHTLY